MSGLITLALFVADTRRYRKVTTAVPFDRSVSRNPTYRSEVHREVTPVKPRVGHHMAKWIGSAVSQRVLFATQNLGTDSPVFEFECPAPMFDDSKTALTFPLSGFPRRSHSTWTSRLGGNDPDFPVTMIRGRDPAGGETHARHRPHP